MIQALGIIVFVLLIAFSIAAHELGHLIPAKRFGVRVTDYMIGFGPTVWSTQRGETRYGVKAFPLGGYIKMIGMLPPARAGARPSGGRLATLVEDARRQALADIGPGDEDRLFYRLPVRKRMVIMLGGPVMNLVLAFVLFAILLVGIGTPQPTLALDATVPCTPTATAPAGDPLPSGRCPTGSAPAPAAAAGLLPGDSIVAVDGVPMTEWADVTGALIPRGGQTVTLTVLPSGGGPAREVNLKVATVERPVVDADGTPTGETQLGGFIGVRPTFAYVPQPWTSVPVTMWAITKASVMALISLPIRLYELVSNTLIGGGERAVDGPVSVVGASRIGGEIAARDEPFVAKAAGFIGLLASLNLFLFLFNLLPILPLDGGHVAGAMYEGVRRRIATSRGRPDPGPVDVARLLPVAYVVAAVLIAMGVIVIWADLVKPISIG